MRLLAQSESFLDTFLAYIAGALLVSVILTALFGGTALLVIKGRKAKVPDWIIAAVFVLLCAMLVAGAYLVSRR